ncbi:uncharacterized protein LOC103718967 [Phoenix dactylifera]|uniref:Uncharacterized protein LOC103718967 n=1 Tax=Phoenix dactylifera TaxID=42345 RepID=A0A8B7CUA5_PHODC|nr:uncharacterized protein LOC103718967 [Phoenix dactylifera]
MASKPNPKLPEEQQQTISPQPPSSSRFRALITQLFNLLPAVGFLFLTVNVIAAAYHARQDPGTLVFVLWSYVNLLLLFLCLKKFESLEADSPPEKRERLKVAIWVLATALNLTFAWRVAGIMPLALAVVIWAMAALVAVAGFYGLFIYKDGNGNCIENSDFGKARLRELSPEEKV